MFTSLNTHNVTDRFFPLNVGFEGLLHCMTLPKRKSDPNDKISFVFFVHNSLVSVFFIIEKRWAPLQFDAPSVGIFLNVSPQRGIS